MYAGKLYKTSMETHTKCREALIPSGAGEVEEGRKKRKEGKKDSHILSWPGREKKDGPRVSGDAVPKG